MVLEQSWGRIWGGSVQNVPFLNHRGALGFVVRCVHDPSMSISMTLSFKAIHISFSIKIDVIQLGQLSSPNVIPRDTGIFHKSHPLSTEKELNPLEILRRKYYRP